MKELVKTLTDRMRLLLFCTDYLLCGSFEWSFHNLLLKLIFFF